MLRASCSRCGRIVEIQKTDAYGLYGPDAGWKDVEQRLLDATTRQWRRPSDYWRGSNGAAFKQAHGLSHEHEQQVKQSGKTEH